jgi:hypothetical protein
VPSENGEQVVADGSRPRRQPVLDAQHRVVAAEVQERPV